MLCDLCNTLRLRSVAAAGHERLNQVGWTRRIARPGRRKAAWLTEHECADCKARWQHVDDPLNPEAGWSMEEEMMAESLELSFMQAA
jgi:hypothetical protein